MMVETLRGRCYRIFERIASAAAMSGRSPTDIRLLAATKKQPIEKVNELLALLRAEGQMALIGESYVQEYRRKCDFLEGEFSSHLIGPLQRNKARNAVKLFDVIESVTSESVAEALSAAAIRMGKVQDVFLQVNTSQDPAKSGFAAQELLHYLSDAFWKLPGLRLCGLMTITAWYDHPEDVQPDFARTAELWHQVREQCSTGIDPLNFQLSMGMSRDFELAIRAGATIVRVGRDLFG